MKAFLSQGPFHSLATLSRKKNKPSLPNKDYWARRSHFAHPAPLPHFLCEKKAASSAQTISLLVDSSVLASGLNQ